MDILRKNSKGGEFGGVECSSSSGACRNGWTEEVDQRVISIRDIDGVLHDVAVYAHAQIFGVGIERVGGEEADAGGLVDTETHRLSCKIVVDGFAYFPGNIPTCRYREIIRPVGVNRIAKDIRR